MARLLQMLAVGVPAESEETRLGHSSDALGVPTPRADALLLQAQVMCDMQIAEHAHAHALALGHQAKVTCCAEFFQVRGRFRPDLPFGCVACHLSR